MSYAVRAWRDTTGASGIEVTTPACCGEYNTTADFTLSSEEEIEQFLARCRAAWERAQTFTEMTYEPAPGSYSDEWD